MNIRIILALFFGVVMACNSNTRSNKINLVLYDGCSIKLEMFDEFTHVLDSFISDHNSQKEIEHIFRKDTSVVRLKYDLIHTINQSDSLYIIGLLNRLKSRAIDESIHRNHENVIGYIKLINGSKWAVVVLDNKDYYLSTICNKKVLNLEIIGMPTKQVSESIINGIVISN